MDAYAEGDAGAFSALYDELAPRLYSYVRRLTGVDVAAEDIVQQVFLRVHDARSRFARGAHVEPWLFAIARRLTIDWARNEGRRWDPNAFESLTSDAQTPDDAASGGQFADALGDELTSVSTKLREAFLLVRVEGFSTAEAAEILGTTALAVKLRAHRAGVLLRPRLRRFRPGGGTE